MAHLLIHRGIVNKQYKENLLKSFKQSFEKGYGIETDIHATKDHEFICFHDFTLNRIFKKKASVKNMEYSKIAGNFFGWLTLKEQKKISKLTRLMRYPCSDGLSYCQLCEGKLNVVLQCYNKIWDIHPLIPLIKNAGGYISTWRGKNPKIGGNILASSSKTLHQKVLNMLKPVA